MIAKIGYNPFPSGCRLISTGDTEQMAEPIKVEQMTRINCVITIMNVYVTKRLYNKKQRPYLSLHGLILASEELRR